MSRIKVLSDDVANRIAAGEVIERPASVVKECVENAIDAESTEIIIKIESGGRDLIQVIDNGCGMTEEEAFLAFERHATSKINTAEDITHINTMGFRGEALPSIASVSLFQLITKTSKDSTATEINFKGGKIDNVQQTAANTGTKVTIRNLFFNVPARRKFLKSEQVEYKHILNYIHHQAVLFNNISFSLYHNGKEKLNYPATQSIENRMLDIFGTSFSKQNFEYFEKQIPLMKISGYLQNYKEENHNYAQLNYIYVNRRYINDKTVFSAIKNAYEPFIKKYSSFQAGKLPNYFIFIQIDPEEIDVNVHPAKTEIRFKYSNAVYTYVRDSVYAKLVEVCENETKVLKQTFTSTFTNPIKVEHKQIKNEDIPINTVKQIEYERKINNTQNYPSAQILSTVTEEYLPLWQLHNSYIFIQVDDGYAIIDQHAAHERILFEKLLLNIKNRKPNSQKLVFPLVIDLPNYITENIRVLVEENKDILYNIGFNVKNFSGNTIVIDEIPSELGFWDGGDVFIEILKQLQEEINEIKDFRIASAMSVACKAAIKAGKKLTKREMQELITDLFKCDFPFQCPHGRPLIINNSIKDLEKMFKRIM